MNINGFYSNNGASTSSNPFPSQMAMNQNPTQFTGAMPMQKSAVPQQPPQQNWTVQMTQPQMQQSMQTINPMQLQGQWLPQQNQAMMAPMMGFNMQLPAHILQDALALSRPVDTTDDSLLYKHILEGIKRGDNYKVILNSLHGQNGHSASLWKDYYLEHKERIDLWIDMCLKRNGQTASTPTELHVKQSAQLSSSASSRNDRTPNASDKVPTIKKPSFSSFKASVGQSARRTSTPSGPPKKTASPSAPLKKSKLDSEPRKVTPQAELAHATGSRRATINSLTVGTPVFDKRLPPPHAEIKIPEPPSRSPSPPTLVIPSARGNKYTEQDDAFFIRFIQWRLKHNPLLTRQELCEMLAEKAPHHTAQSWGSHWQIHHDLPDKILASARGDEWTEESYQSSAPPPRKRPRYKEESSSEEEDNDDDSSDEGAAASVPRRRGRPPKVRSPEVKREAVEDSDSNAPIRVWSESEMGPSGGAFTAADMYITAKYISEFRGWDATSAKDRWEPFGEKYPQRSAKSWCEYYRRCGKEIDRLVRKIRKERQKTTEGTLFS